jgi:hypothetical protein
MATFNGQNIAGTFKSILNIGESSCFNCQLPSAPGQCIVTDGMGCSSSISLGLETAGLTVTGNICNDSLLKTTGTICGNNLCITNDMTIGNDITSSGKVQGSCLCSTGDGCADGDFFVGDDLVVGACTGNNGHLTVKGTIQGCNDIIAFYSSDKNLKEDLNKIDSQTIVKGLTGYKFNWKEEAQREGTDLGIMAQDAAEVVPEIVHKRDDGYLAVDYIKLIPVLIEEVNRLSSEIEKLKSN